MSNQGDILIQYISEQIALEEQLLQIINQQLISIDGNQFAEAKSVLTHASEVLTQHYAPLNQLLERIESETLLAHSKYAGGNGYDDPSRSLHERQQAKVSRMLRDDYSALNLITISNTLLHTTALALDSLEVATLSLRHLENLAPIVVRIGELMPTMIARELQTICTNIDPSAAEKALENIRLAWSRHN